MSNSLVLARTVTENLQGLETTLKLGPDLADVYDQVDPLITLQRDKRVYLRLLS